MKKLIEKLEAILNLIPKDDVLYPIIADNMSSVNYAAPEMCMFWVEEITENLSKHISYPPKEDWQRQVFEIWTERKYL